MPDLPQYVYTNSKTVTWGSNKLKKSSELLDLPRTRTETRNARESTETLRDCRLGIPPSRKGALIREATGAE